MCFKGCGTDGGAGHGEEGSISLGLGLPSFMSTCLFVCLTDVCVPDVRASVCVAGDGVCVLVFLCMSRPVGVAQKLFGHQVCLWV